MKNRVFHPRGFTLVEIMIVMVIVGILSAIAVPSLHHLKRKSEETMIMNTLRQVYNAKEYYFTETGSSAVSFARLAAQGYASKSLAVAVAHPPGDWEFATFPWLRPGAPVSSTEVIIGKNRVATFNRKLQYPPN